MLTVDEPLAKKIEEKTIAIDGYAVIVNRLKNIKTEVQSDENFTPACLVYLEQESKSLASELNAEISNLQAFVNDRDQIMALSTVSGKESLLYLVDRAKFAVTQAQQCVTVAESIYYKEGGNEGR
ncbi:MAG: DUF1845 family protein [Nitrospirae bacterium]|nr:DUF1845 family protein [Nitrospirota bacterium]